MAVAVSGGDGGGVDKFISLRRVKNERESFFYLCFLRRKKVRRTSSSLCAVAA
jgi:hypothetical protein